MVQNRSDYFKHFYNSVFIALGSTFLDLDGCTCIMVNGFCSLKKRGILLWMLSTKMLPAVGVLYPIYILFIALGILDSRIGLVVVLMLMNLPIIVWMLYTYFREIPEEILEASRMDGPGCEKKYFLF